MQLTDWNRNTSLLALQLSVDYFLGAKAAPSQPLERPSLPRPAQRPAPGPAKRIVRQPRVHAG